MPVPRTPSIHVVLDTNCLFTEAEDKLVSAEIGSYIAASAGELGLDVTWHLPSVVRLERKRQMLEGATRLLDSVAKIENLLGHKLGISEEILESRVEEAIQRQMKALKLAELKLDTDKVPWDDLIQSAVYRRPPFSGGKTEKGFKDAVILECFGQLMSSLPHSPKSCRIVLLTADTLLIEAAKLRVGENKAAVVVESLGSLRTMLNAIAAHLPQEAVDELIPKARRLFLTRGGKDGAGLYYKFEIGNLIGATPEMKDRPPLSFDWQWERTNVNGTTFVGKSGQTVRFATEVAVTASAKRFVIARRLGRSGALAIPDETPREVSVDANPAPASSLAGGLLAHLSATETKSVKDVGELTFSVEWEAILSQSGNLMKPRLGKVVAVSTSWAEENSAVSA